ncbi:MAG: folate-binding protein [Burkholderiales bacterium]
MNPSFDLGPGGATSLPHWGVLRAQGDDAAQFLHGQLSNDIVKLDASRACLAAYCTAQGRMLASFVITRPQPTDLWLACSADVLPATLKRLSMFVLRAKARLSDASQHLVVLGLTGPTAAQWLGEAAGTQDWQAVQRDGASIVRLPAVDGIERWLWIGPIDQASTVLAALPALDEAVWRWLETRSGLAQVQAATSGQFVPQMLNYEVLGGVDFRKGCYPGQEIVARSQYLGKLKRRAFLVEGPTTLQAGQEVYWSEDAGQPAGLVAQAALQPGGAGGTAVVELKLAVTDTGRLHLGTPQGPLLTLVPLPYALPTEAAPAKSGAVG